jgi:hypothetical protein
MQARPQNTYLNAAGSAAQNQRNGQKAAKIPANEPGLPGAQGSSANNRDNPNSKDKITGTTSKSNSLLESNETGEPATSPPSSATAFRSLNHIAAKEMSAWAGDTGAPY